MEKKDSTTAASNGGGPKKYVSTKLPPVPNAVNPQVETVSPATRLLEKRRLMYEKQEQYEKKKKEFKL